MCICTASNAKQTYVTVSKGGWALETGCYLCPLSISQQQKEAGYHF